VQILHIVVLVKGEAVATSVTVREFLRVHGGGVQGLVDVSNVVDEASELVGSDIVIRLRISQESFELRNGVDNVGLVDFDVLFRNSIEIWNVSVVPCALNGHRGLVKVLLVAKVLPLVRESSGLNEGPLVLPLAVGKSGQESLSSGFDLRGSLFHLIESDLGGDHVSVGPPGLSGLGESKHN